MPVSTSDLQEKSPHASHSESWVSTCSLWSPASTPKYRNKDMGRVELEFELDKVSTSTRAWSFRWPSFTKVV